MVVLSCVVIVAGVATILLAAERERRISALKSDFVANVSHELKTPLALVRMFGEMLQSGRVASEEKRQEYLEIIVSESERLSALIENVLDFAQVERGRQAYEFADGRRRRGRGERRRTSTDTAPSARGSSSRLEVEARFRAARIDERAIQLAVINLIDNALKYAPELTRGRHVSSVARRRRDRRARERRGPGVPPEERERIFERFVRGRRRDAGADSPRPRQRHRPRAREAHRREPRRPRLGREPARSGRAAIPRAPRGELRDRDSRSSMPSPRFGGRELTGGPCWISWTDSKDRPGRLRGSPSAAWPGRARTGRRS